MATLAVGRGLKFLGFVIGNGGWMAVTIFFELGQPARPGRRLAARRGKVLTQCF